jgi:tetratricopeptide (TPR) repeat protein
VTYPPYPNYQNTPSVQLDFDANKISDARLIRTFPISQPEMNALEIQFRGASALYNKGDFYGAYQAFAGQFHFRGNYLSPYWAGLSALKMGNRQAATDLLNQALSINPYYEPARSAIVAAQTYVPSPQPQQPAQPKIQKRVRRSK